ncbi:MAG: HAMP domain-containing histidine kinase [Flavobacteriaceae bacterium]
MKYKSYIFKLFFRIFVFVTLILGIIYTILEDKITYTILISFGTLFSIIELYNFTKRRFAALDDFFEAVKYQDFSRWFPEERGSKDIRFLYNGFNEVNRTIKEINKKNEAQYIYLQKILEMVDIGIIAYNLESGDVMWMNNSFKEIIDFSSFKNIRFVEKRRQELYNTIFETYNREPNSVSIALQNERIKVLISDTIFNIDDNSFKLIVLQNIDDTLNKNESEAWKKLLSVMTHEIMNSIAPISSLADTLQRSIELNLNDPKEYKIVPEDLNDGLKTIKNRSQGLLKFAKTYRSLSKVTHLNLKKVNVEDLFRNIELLMSPTMQSKNIEIVFSVNSKRLSLEVDVHLIEQVLINLILNAKDACLNVKNPKIRVEASQNQNRTTTIKVYDNGSGIPKDIIENIFVPFFTSKSTGSGIGLSLCKQIMLLHKGKILVNSKENEGTVFSIIF